MTLGLISMTFGIREEPLKVWYLFMHRWIRLSVKEDCAKERAVELKT